MFLCKQKRAVYKIFIELNRKKNNNEMNKNIVLNKYFGVLNRGGFHKNGNRLFNI